MKQYIPHIICVILWSGFIAYVAFADQATIKLNTLMLWAGLMVAVIAAIVIGLVGSFS